MTKRFAQIRLTRHVWPDGRHTFGGYIANEPHMPPCSAIWETPELAEAQTRRLCDRYDSLRNATVTVAPGGFWPEPD